MQKSGFPKIIFWYKLALALPVQKNKVFAARFAGAHDVGAGGGAGAGGLGGAAGGA